MNILLFRKGPTVVGIDKDGISANTPNDGIGKSDTSACCNSEQPSLSLILGNNVHDGNGA